jgi:hypothetical protein
MSPGQREEALSDALRDIELGAYDEMTIGWLARNLDNPRLRAIVSLIERTRGADPENMLDIEASFAHLAHPTIGEDEQRPDRPSWVAGNSGPGF